MSFANSNPTPNIRTDADELSSLPAPSCRYRRRRPPPHRTSRRRTGVLGTCSYTFSVLNQLVNSPVWADNSLSACAVCDAKSVTIRILIVASVGLPAASLSMQRGSSRIASVKVVSISKAENRRATLVDALMCTSPCASSLPLLFLACYY
ncbi:hypothetical protein DFH06DRAFT_147178 [Mycena polygramma]|nr:hypothetical protein DFH06DRAFT_147178 [Mycena polygramma]